MSSSSEEDDDFVPDPEEYHEEPDLDIPAELLEPPPPPKPKLVFVLLRFLLLTICSTFLERPVTFYADFYEDLRQPADLPALYEQTPTMPKLVADFGVFQARKDFQPALIQWVSKYSRSNYESVVKAHRDRVAALEKRLAAEGLADTEKPALQKQLDESRPNLQKAEEQRDRHAATARAREVSAEEVHATVMTRLTRLREPLRAQLQEEAREAKRTITRRKKKRKKTTLASTLAQLSLLGKRPRNEDEEEQQNRNSQGPPHKRPRLSKNKKSIKVRRGLDAVLAQLEPSQDSAVQRSRDEWESWKEQHEELAYEVEKAAEDGEVGQQEFLDRTNLVEFEGVKVLRNEDREMRHRQAQLAAKRRN